MEVEEDYKYDFIDRFIFLDYTIDLPSLYVRKGWYQVVDIVDNNWYLKNDYFGGKIVPDRYLSFSISSETPFADDLDYSLLLEKDSENGWISPSGEFFGCDFFYHKMIAEMYLHSSEYNLEEHGWIKLTSAAGPLVKGFKITEEQLETLVRKGYTRDNLEDRYYIIN